MLKKIKIILLVLFFFTGCAENDKNFKQFNIEDLNITKLKESNFNKDLSEFYIINFWASWCEPCKKEVELLNSLNKNVKNLKIVGISIMDTFSDANNFLNTQKVNYENYFDENLISLDYFISINSIPVTFLMDKSNNIIFRINGELTPDDYTRIIRAIK
tara:strand:+ start:25735 stop:26211 length:477 start_codon:yes stop_codon:yes gene_type:complete